jgi:sec-independent protein translocase protein TatC
MAPIRPVDFEDRLTLIEHLDELRSRLIVCAVVFGVALALCFWQNHLLLDIANAPLPRDLEPLTFGVAEPFTTTLTVSAYGAIILSMPVLIYELYAFVLPALHPREKKLAFPLMLMIPALFIAGVVFAYFVVVPAAVKFLLNFNDDQFNVEVRARDYYSFFSLTLVSVGAVFQVPVGILAATRLGVVTPKQLSQNRRYAYLICAIVAMLLPGTDPVSMLIEMVPLVLLFELSLILARIFGPAHEPDSGVDAATGEAPG